MQEIDGNIKRQIHCHVYRSATPLKCTMDNADQLNLLLRIRNKVQQNRVTYMPAASIFFIKLIDIHVLFMS